MKHLIAATFAIALAFGLTATETNAAFTLDTATFTSGGTGSPPSSMGTGTLPPSNSLTLSTSAVGNAGLVATQNWGAAEGGTVTTSSMSLFALGTGTTSSVTFSSAVTNPYLLFNYTDATSAMNFSAYAGSGIVLIYENNASVSTSTGLVTFVGSANSYVDAFAIELLGTFSTISFGYTDPTASNTVAFTVGFNAAVPEPSSMMMGSTALVIGLGFAGFRRCRRRAIA
jgi:hypothetical protein